MDDATPAQIGPRQHTSKRIRPSQAAVSAALRALQSAGLPVNKVCVSGGQIEIHCGAVEHEDTRKKDDGLEEW